MSSNSLTPAERAELERELEREQGYGARREQCCPICGGPLSDDSSLTSDGVNAAVRVCSACVSER